MIYLQLFLSFLKIGLFGFGGGLAIFSLIQHEIETYGWMTLSNHGAGVVPNLIQQKLEGVFSVSGVFYLEKHHIIKTIL